LRYARRRLKRRTGALDGEGLRFKAEASGIAKSIEIVN
jgi:hypothetical protein